MQEATNLCCATEMDRRQMLKFLVLIRALEMRTLPLAIQVFFYTYRTTDWGQVFAALTVGTLPTIILYLYLQRMFIRGLTSEVAKG
jgi:raffinose/stachyose/melibiose transport system permease protein